MTKQFALNETTATLLFRSGYITILPGSYIGLETDELSTQEFRDAKARKWISIHDTEPTAAMLPTVETVVIENPNKGMTAEELAAELTKEQKKDDGVTIEALGKGAPIGAESEEKATVEAIGQGTTEEVVPADLTGDAAPAAAPAKGRKTKQG